MIWPFVTLSFSLASTASSVPESSLPTSTERVGCSVPLAEMLTTRLPVAASSVR